MKKYVHFKKGRNPVQITDLQRVNPYLWRMLAWVIEYCERHGLECTVTSILREDGIHADGRAFDLRSRSWPDYHIENIQKEMKKRFSKIAAIGRDSGLPEPCIYHKVDDDEYHFHFQCKRRS